MNGTKFRATFERSALDPVLTEATRVAPGRASLPVLGGVKISSDDGIVAVEATDLELHYRRLTEAKVESWGVIVVPGKQLKETLRKLPKDKPVTIEALEADVISIATDKARFTISGFPPGDYPQTPETKSGVGVTGQSAKLRDAFTAISGVASADEARPVLEGVQFVLTPTGLLLVATDSYRIGTIEFEGTFSVDETYQFIVPGKALASLAKMLKGNEPLFIHLNESRAEFQTAKLQIKARIIEGEFPNWKQLTPERTGNVLKGDSGALIEAVETAGTVVQSNTPVKLHLGDEIRVSASEAGVGDVEIPIEACHFDGEPMIVAFNPKFLAEGIRFIGAERIAISITNPAKPVRFEPDGLATRKASYVLMPVRLP